MMNGRNSRSVLLFIVQRSSFTCFTSGFTQARSGWPVTPAIRLSAAISAIALRLLTVALAMCGATTQFGSMQQRVVGQRRLGIGDVQPGGEDHALPQGVGQIRLDDQRAAGRVHEHGRPLHLAKRGGVEHAARRCRSGRCEPR